MNCRLTIIVICANQNFNGWSIHQHTFRTYWLNLRNTEQKKNMHVMNIKIAVFTEGFQAENQTILLNVFYFVLFHKCFRFLAAYE